MNNYLLYQILLLVVTLTYSCKEDSKDEVALRAIDVIPPKFDLVVGESLTINAAPIPTYADSHEMPFEWKSGNPAVATVSLSGEVKPLSVGATEITVRARINHRIYKKIPITVTDKTVGLNYHLYLLVGQSNMAGRGEIDAHSTPNNPRIVMLTEDNKWSIARDPLHFDKPKVAGVGPGLAFAQKMLTFEEDDKVKIGLIPCAVGGTSITMWQPGKDAYDGQYFPYDDAIKRLHKAMRDGKVMGIIWHQGEADSREDRVKVYIENLQVLVNRFRNEINDPNIPFVAGELGYYNDNYALINDELQKLTESIPFSALATSEGLTHKGDNTHFDTESARKLGERLAIRMHELQTATRNIYSFKEK